MKKLEIIIKPEKLENLKSILDDCKASGVMISNIMGYGNQRGYTQMYRGTESVSYTHLDVYKRQAEYSAIAFDCALSGPFGNLHLDPALTSPDSLCAHRYFDLRFNGLLC